jgi:PncC family amidohydrolase
VGAPDQSAVEVLVGRLLRQREMTLATAESCTGGLIGHRVTNVPGSSAYFVAAITAYSYEAKELLLHVRRETLDEYGAVSEQTAREMAQGVRHMVRAHMVRADVSVAVTGIAGPAGGTPDKPVGLVYIALSAPEGEWVEQHVWRGDRWENKERSAEAALDLLRRYLEDHL